MIIDVVHETEVRVRVDKGTEVIKMQDSGFLNRPPLQQVGAVSPVPQAVAPPPQVFETLSPQPLAPRVVESYSMPAYSVTTPAPPRVMSSYGSVSPGIASV